MSHPTWLVLAAGAGRRFGTQPKLLAELPATVAANLLDLKLRALSELSRAPTIVVIGAHGEAMQQWLDKSGWSQHAGLKVVHNAHWQEGQSRSIIAGLEAIKVDCPALAIVLADQWGLGADELGRLQALWAQAPAHIACARYSDESEEILSVPAIFPRSSFDQLRGLRGDQGARKVIRHQATTVRSLNLPQAAYDMDTQEDLAELLKALSSS